MSFGLKVKDSFLELLPDATISVTGSNPAFDKDIVGRTFSYPFKIPTSAANLRLVKHLNRIDAKRTTKIPAILTSEGSKIDAGYLNIISVKSDAIEASFLNYGIDWLTKLKDLKIRSLMPVVNIPQTITPIWRFSPAAPPTTYNITIQGHTFIYTPSGSGPGAIPAAVTAYAALINATIPGCASYNGTSGTLDIIPTADPFVVNLSTLAGLTLLTFYTYATAQEANLQAHLTALQTTPAATHCWPVIANYGFYGTDINPYYHNYINYRHGATQGLNDQHDEKRFEYNYVPQVYVKYVFDQIASHLGFAWSGDFYNSAEFAAVCVYNNYAIDQLRQEYYSLGLKWMNGHQASLDLSKRVPDYTALDFILKVFDFLNVYPTVNDKTVYIRRRVDQVRSKPIEISKAIDPTTVNMALKEILGFAISFVADDKDTYVASPTQLGSYTSGAGTTKIELPARPLQDWTTLDFYLPGSEWKVCRLFQKGSSDELDLGKDNATGFRLFFAWGMRPSQFSTYNMSSHTNTRYDGTVIGNFSMELGGSDGLFEVLFKGWSELIDANQIEVIAVLTPGQLSLLAKWKTPTVQFYHPLGQVKAIVQMFEVQQTAQGLSTTKLTLQKL